MVNVLILLSLFSSNFDRSEWVKPSQWTKVRKEMITKNKKSFGWIDTYTGDTIANSSSLDLDHVVPLKYVFEHGGSSFSDSLKHSFAIDTNNLILTSEHENRSKGDKGVLEYLPPKNKELYLSKWKKIVKKYKIKISKEEKDIIK